MAVPIHLYEEISHGGRNQLVRQEYDALDADPTARCGPAYEIVRGALVIVRKAHCVCADAAAADACRHAVSTISMGLVPRRVCSSV